MMKFFQTFKSTLFYNNYYCIRSSFVIYIKLIKKMYTLVQENLLGVTV